MAEAVLINIPLRAVKEPYGTTQFKTVIIRTLCQIPSVVQLNQLKVQVLHKRPQLMSHQLQTKRKRKLVALQRINLLYNKALHQHRSHSHRSLTRLKQLLRHQQQINHSLLKQPAQRMHHKPPPPHQNPMGHQKLQHLHLQMQHHHSQPVRVEFANVKALWVTTKIAINSIAASTMVKEDSIATSTLVLLVPAGMSLCKHAITKVM